MSEPEFDLDRFVSEFNVRIKVINDKLDDYKRIISELEKSPRYADAPRAKPRVDKDGATP